MKHWLVIYDVRDPKRLARIANKMTEYGIRVQQSVFEVEAPEMVIQKLRKHVRELMEKEDYVVYFNICERDWQKRQKFGKQVYRESEPRNYHIY